MSRSNEPTNHQTSGPYSGDFTEEVPSSEEQPSGTRGAGAAPAKAKKSSVAFVATLAVVVVVVAAVGFMTFRPRHVTRAPVHPTQVQPKATTPVKAPAPAPVLPKAPASNNDVSVLTGTTPSAAPAVAASLNQPAPAPLNPVLAPPAATPIAANPLAAPSTTGVLPAANLAPVAPVNPASSATVSAKPTPAVPVPVTLAPPAPASSAAITHTLPATPAPIAPAPAISPSPAPVVAPITTSSPNEPLVGQVAGLTVRVDNLEQRVQALEEGQGQLKDRIDHLGPQPRKVVPTRHVREASVKKASLSHHVRSHVRNRVELITDKPKSVKVNEAHVAKSVCHLASIVPERAWIKNDDGTFTTYGVGDMAPNGSVIKSIDPTTGIVTAKGKLDCDQNQ